MICIQSIGKNERFNNTWNIIKRQTDETEKLLSRFAAEKILEIMMEYMSLHISHR